MSSDESQPGREELQFDRVETGAPPPDATIGGLNVACEACGRSVGAEYFTVNDKPVCGDCRTTLLEAAKTPRSAGPLLRSGLFGLVAAIVGAAIYYAVIAITNFEIGLVAILIGYMVGYSVRKGANGRGGRRFQVLAVVLTYLAVGLAYAPLAFRELARAEKSAQMLVFVFALPIMSIISSFPGGLLSALIIGIGLYQAWSMTGRPKLAVAGPYKVGPGVTPEPDQPTP